VAMIKEYQAESVALFRKAKKKCGPAEVLLDVGSGIRPQSIFECRRQICFEAHDEYVEVLRAAGCEVVQGVAPDGLRGLDVGEPIDTAVSIDVIEHLEKDAGRAMVEEMVRIATRRVVIFTPLGFLPQECGDVDSWGMQGQHWQTHRSGWTPEDFPGWFCLVDRRFHHNNAESNKKNPCGALLAILEK
jgi:hypothetical protein